MKIIISSYKTNGDSIGLFNLTNNKFRKLSSKDIIAPSFVVSQDNYVYTFGKSPGVSLYAYKVEGDELLLVDELEIPGKSCTHLKYSNKNKILFGCSYSDGAFFSVGVSKGKFSKLHTYQNQIEDDRLSRCHCVFLNKEENMLGVVNIALDAIYFYKIENEDLKYQKMLELPNGSGPRHALYNKDNSLIYIITEYSNEILVVAAKTMEIVQRISTIPNYKGESFGATLVFSKDGEYLYASNRGEDSIAKYLVLDDGKLKYISSFSCGGKHPRHMILSQDGKYIISCNKDSDNVTLIDILSEEVLLSIPFKNVSGVTILNNL